MKKIVLTGGPSVGKTTVIEILASRGYNIIPESARMIIEEEKLKNSDALPGKNVAKFQELVAERQIQSESQAEAKDTVLFHDRGILDGFAYCTLNNIPVPHVILDHSKGRYDKIFFLASLNIYVEDGIRSRAFEDADKVHSAIKEAYIKFGYTPIDVPVLPPEERVDFILKML